MTMRYWPILFLFLATTAKAQLMLSPGVSLGYTFGAGGFTIGAELSALDKSRAGIGAVMDISYAFAGRLWALSVAPELIVISIGPKISFDSSGSYFGIDLRVFAPLILSSSTRSYVAYPVWDHTYTFQDRPEENSLQLMIKEYPINILPEGSAF